MKRLAHLGSISASIITYLELTRDIIKETWTQLENGRPSQINLASILSATRFQCFRKNRIFHVKCPKRHCYQKDGFLHMLDCYNIAKDVRKGTAAVQFLQHMAKVTLYDEDLHRIPYPDELTPEARHHMATPIMELMEASHPVPAPTCTNTTIEVNHQTSWHTELLGADCTS